MKIYLIDIDGVLCDDLKGNYQDAKPNFENIKKVNKLYDEGNFIRIFTGRGSGTGLNWTSITQNQLKVWGVKYHEIIYGKPVYDISIDDKAINVKDW